MPYALYAFGNNKFNQLGITHDIHVNALGNREGTDEKVSTPVFVDYPPPNEPLASINGGANHTLLCTINGTILGAGDNSEVQIKTSHRERVVKFEKLYENVGLCATAITSTAHIVNRWDPDLGSPYHEAHVYTEGACGWGELCNGVAKDSSKSSNGKGSFENSLPGKAIGFTAGTHHYVVVLDDGSIWGWGKTRCGQLGVVGSSIVKPTKIPVPFSAEKVVCGNDFTYIVGPPTTNNQHFLGRDKYGIKEALNTSIQGYKNIAATWHAIFILFEDGTLKARGKQNQWHLIPPNLPLIEQIACGTDHILALTKTNKLLAWGWGEDGNCGDLSKLCSPASANYVSGRWNEISGIPGEIVKIGAGYNTSFVLTSVAETSERVNMS